MNFEVDKKEFIKQYQKEAEEHGLVVKVYLQNIDLNGDDDSTLVSAPNINIAGNANPLNAASMIIALETAIEELKSVPDVKEVLSALRIFQQKGEKIVIENNRRCKDE